MKKAEIMGNKLWIVSLFTLSLGATAALTGCNPEHMSAPGQLAGPSGIGGASQRVAYTSGIQSLFALRCGSCHNSTSAIPNWTNYDVAFSKKSAIYQRVVVDKSMPMGAAGAAMTQDERNQVAQWVNNGAPMNPPTNGSPNSGPVVGQPGVPVEGPPGSSGCDSSQNSKLFAASKAGDFKTVQQLVSANACVTAKDVRGVSVLLAAILDGDSNVVAFTDIAKLFLMLGKGATDLNESYNGVTALNWAVTRGFTEIASVLIEAGADVNALVDVSTNDSLKGKKGYSPAMLAVLAEDGETLKNLFHRGATPDTKAVNGNTAKTLADQLVDSPEKTAIQELIKQYSQVSYTKDVLPIFTKRCASCHNSGWAEVNWTEFKTAKAFRHNIKNCAVDNFYNTKSAGMGLAESCFGAPMPPLDNITKMTEAERQIVKKWVEGHAAFGGVPPVAPISLQDPVPAPTPGPDPSPAPTPTPDPTGSPVPLPLVPTYTNSIQALIERRCSKCHNASWADRNWMDYKTAFSFKSTIMARAVKEKDMPPGNQTAMTDDERTELGVWIKAGAPR